MKYLVILNDGTQSLGDLDWAQWFLKNAMDRDLRVTGKIYRLVEI